jgi:putative intracellular protease/amidase
MPLTRRDLGPLIAFAALAGGRLPVAAAEHVAPPPPDHDMSGMPPSWHGNEKIAFLAYPGFTALDLVGPHYMLSGLMGAQTLIVAKTREPVVSDAKLALVPTITFDDCPMELDVICVPGGSTGTLAAMEDEATIRFLADRGARARYVTSVCTGSLVLGAAGLLKGYKATSHWVTRDILKDLGALPVDARVVTDRNRITGAGVTAGIDFGLTLVAKMRDQLYAEGMQLLAEYAPEPPFNAGTPATAPKASVDIISGMFVDFHATARAAAQRAAAKLPG